MNRWYTTREAVKAAAGISGTSLNAVIDSKIAAASEDVEELLGFTFYPVTDTRLYRWPQRHNGGSVFYMPNGDLIAVTTLISQAQDDSPTTLTSYFLEPYNEGPPYNRIEIDLSGSDAFEGGATPQRSISIAGQFGYKAATESAGTVASGLDSSASATSGVCSDSSLIGVGDMLLIESESLFVSEKGLVDTTADLNGDLTASKSNVTVTVDDGSQLNAGEIITLDSERMLIESISTNDVTVERAYDGSTLAAHTGSVDVYAPRTLTLVRGQDGTTAATHADATAISRYVPPGDVRDYVQAWVIFHLYQDGANWTGVMGGDLAAVEVRGTGINNLKFALREKYGRVSL